MYQLTEGDRHWVAGVLDLKGSIIRKKNAARATPQIILYVETKQYPVVRTLAQLTGTSPELQEAKNVEDWMRRGCRQHCPDPHVHVNERDYEWKMPAVARWTVSGAAAATVLYNTLPYMHNNKGFVEDMREMLDYAVTSGQGWGATRSALRRLRDHGWTLPTRFASLDLGPSTTTPEANQEAA